MKGLFKRVTAVSAAAAVSLGALCVFPVSADSAEPLTIEGEDLKGATLWTSIYETKLPGYSGEGFAYLTNDPLSFTMEVPEEGMYSVVVHGAQILSEGGRLETVTVNGIEYSKIMPYSEQWTDFDFGNIRLKKGKNAFSFINKYGYMAIDYVTVSPAVFPDLSKATAELNDPKATPEAKALMTYLKSVYGKNTLSGQQQIYGGGNKVQKDIRYDAASDQCVDSAGNTYPIDRDSKDTDAQGNVFYWHCSDEKTGQIYTYDTQNRNYGYNDYNNDVNLIYQMTGKYPAIQGFDLNCHNPGFGWEDGVTDRMIDWANNKNGIVTISWHCTVPKDMSKVVIDDEGKLASIDAEGNYAPLSNDWQQYDYSEKTNFVTANIMVEGTKENLFYNEAIRLAAGELLKLQEAGVPAIFRPLHEAEGNPDQENPGSGKGAWFWWSKEGAEVYNALWRYLYDKLTNEYGVHNLIWEQNLYAWSDYSKLWYSGDDVVDIVALDKYNVEYNRHDGNASLSGPNYDAESASFYMLNDFVSGKKMVAMAECDSVPSLSNMTTEHGYWLYFCPWYDDTTNKKFLTDPIYQDPASLKELYNSDFCITLDELPADLYQSGAAEHPQTTPALVQTTEGQQAPEAMRGDVDMSGVVDVSDAVLLARFVVGDSVNVTEQGQANGEMNDDNKLTTDDVILIVKQIVSTE